MSLLALIDGDRVRATPGAEGTCPACRRPMIAKCGRIVTWHWAHRAADACDPWRRGETDWHLRWKVRLLEAGAQVEVPMRNGDELHIADAVIGDLVVELAGVYPPAEQIAARERFYARMAWIYNAERFLDRVEIYDKGSERRFRFKQPAKAMALHRRPVYWHDPEIDCAVRLRWIKRYADDEASGRTYGGLGAWIPADDLINKLVQGVLL